MNRQPYGTPPRWWEPKLSPTFVRLSRRRRRKQLRERQLLTEVRASGLEHVVRAVEGGQGVLITPNHSVHYDSAALYLAADEADSPLYFMVAWQVFGMATNFECWAMQRLGCFSIDRESTDRQAFKQAVQILEDESHPLVIFPEGDIYHTGDRVTPFREGAAAIAITAAKREKRPVVTIPCGIRFTYVDDPSPGLHDLLDRLEARLHLRNRRDMPLADRIHRFAEAALALKELDYVGSTSSGKLRDRVVALTEAVLQQLEERHDIRPSDRTPPERAKELRRRIIDKIEDDQLRIAQPDAYRQLQQDMEDVFFVIQCFSYPGDYLAEQPSIERMAETLDKFEEDVFGVDVPGVRGRRRVDIEFGEPIAVPSARQRDGSAELTKTMQSRVQGIIDGLRAATT
jgi:1-acyl-sn-glycerol-3-phosphate acyltransferase